MRESGRADDALNDDLARTAASIISDARHALSDPRLTEPRRVHDVRKAFKRWRALMRLLSEALGEPAKQMRREARDLMRVLSTARDAQAALDALEDLQKAAPEFPARSRDSIGRRLLAMRDVAEKESGLTDQMRDRIAHYLERAENEVAGWPSTRMGADTVTEKVTTTYRRARKLIPDDWEGVGDEQLHELRRRVVEFRHQMDLVVSLWPGVGAGLPEEAQRLRRQLGACQDLSVLGGLIAPHQPLARWRSRLTPAIAARRESHVKSAARGAARLFADKPKAFRQRLEAARRGRRPRSG